jgi:hypothetical protein
MADFDTIERVADSLVTMRPDRVDRFGHMVGWNR